MPIYEGSRYTKVSQYSRDNKLVFKRRDRIKFDAVNCTNHIFIEGETLDVLATKYYGDSQLWWVFLESNPNYRNELDISSGDIILVPLYEEVIKLYG